jgi:lysyl-tRNA synthetase class I
MSRLNQIVDELITHHPKGEILVESGPAPFGTYHLGHLRELLTHPSLKLEKWRAKSSR